VCVCIFHSKVLWGQDITNFSDAAADRWYVVHPYRQISILIFFLLRCILYWDVKKNCKKNDYYVRVALRLRNDVVCTKRVFMIIYFKFILLLYNQLTLILI
jgi:hypothetical protein